MFNCLLDGFPTKYRDYAINTDYRYGILLSLLLEDDTIDEDLKFLQAFNLLYKENVPADIKTAIEGVIWFVSCGKSEIFFEEDYFETHSSDRGIDFNVDHMDIWGAFWAKGIDLLEVDMHWFKFMSALSNLGDCPLTQKISYRTMDLSKLKGDTRKFYIDLKNKYKIRKMLTKEEHDELLNSMREKYGSYYVKMKYGQ